MKYIDLQAIKSVPIVEILADVGIEPVRRRADDWWYYAPWRKENTPSMHVRLSSNTWKDFAEEKSGTSNIDLVIRLGIARNWREAAEWIEDTVLHNAYGNRPLQSRQSQSSSKTTYQIVKVNPISEESIIGKYVLSRGISIATAKQYCVDLVFRDSNGRLRRVIAMRNRQGGYPMRGPGEKGIKGCLGPADITVINNGSAICDVYEGFFDYLSAHELALTENHDSIVLNSVSHIQRAIKHLLTVEYESVIVYMDNDTPGRKASMQICEAIDVAYDGAILYEGYKDMNEFLLK